MADLTSEQRRILHGLTLGGGSIVSPSEMAEVQPLRLKRYVTIWRAEGGFLAWGITGEGREALAAAQTEEPRSAEPGS